MNLKSRGWIMKKVYPTVGKFLAGEDVPKEVVAFFDRQPLNVLKFLNWERKKYSKASPFSDPIRKDFIPTGNQDIFYITPKKRDMANTPIFFACPKCNGRLFHGMKYCGWCGCDPKINVKRDKAIEVVKRFFEFISPTTSRPPLAKILSAFSEKSFIDDINKQEFKKTLNDIDSMIPVEAYIK